ncbi:MAG: aspartate/methionine/tyrosine aminotransferase, partial [Candidatus Azotimanducaceae bacterium]
RGLIELRQAVCAYYGQRFDVDVAAERVFITAGASGGLLLLTAALLNSGENLLMTDPGYPCNRHFLSAFGAEGRLIPVGPEQNYQITPDLIGRYWNESTRGVLLASPANPTGSVISTQEMREISRAVNQRQGLMMVDEIYQGLVYDNLSPSTVLQVNDDALVINSFSKYFGMTGWRLGWIVVPQLIAGEIEKLAQNLFICPSTIAQHAALAAFDDQALAEMESYRLAFEERRDYLVPAISDLGFRVHAMPKGAFYVYAELPEALAESESFCQRLLEEQYVAITPGTDFGFEGSDRHVRISYAREMSQLIEAVKRIGSLLS